MIGLSNIQERIERSFYEALRLRAVHEGFTPDITTYSQDQAGYDQYKIDLNAIYTAGGFAVELFGVSNPQDKGYKKLPRLVFSTESFMPGEYGIETTEWNEYQPNTDTYQAKRTSQAITHQMFMSCYAVADTVNEMRTLVAMVNSTLPLRGQLKYADDPDNNFFVEMVDFVDLDDPTNGIMEKVYRFRIPDIIWTDDILEDTWVPIHYINMNILIAKHLGIGVWIPESPYVGLMTKDGILLQTNKDQLILVKL